MNRLLLTGNLLLLAIVIVMSGFLLSPSRNDGHPPTPPFKSCYECGDASFYGIPIDEFLKDVARYRRTHDSMINKEPYMRNHKLEDARACWFSLDTLEKYICLIKRFSGKLGLADSLLGVRFYYGVYPSDPNSLWNPDYVSLHTLFMVPTFRKISKKDTTDIDFDPRVSRQPLASYFNLGATGMPRVMVFDLGGQQRSEGMAKNQGQLCPPNCPPDNLSTLATADQQYPNETYPAH